ncbi:hypothetical protein OV208_40140 [Corallococcus sp. bb12-1]|uniref:hypothetical protein n=1 Tax=Corallococcus sp. bb12-1 TaxID=2996784 RepID=UPI002270D4BD|nr:hypothetical protein [Corallococcus sp. bb12-1]MCY1047579.1 hypothetical protein [Corallococcus sp. bb12-1]
MGSAASVVSASAVRERPILFSADMVRALLDGRKTVTRRLLKPQPAPNAPHDGGTVWEFRPDNGLHVPCGTVGHLTVAEKMGLRCPYGQPGERLWVKEAWRPCVAHSHGMDACDCGDVSITYRADGAERFFADRDVPNEWTMPRAAERGNVTPLFMPRWASRLTLEVGSVRVERLHDITEEDAQAEGVERHPESCGWLNYEPSPPFESVSYHLTARESFASLWRSLNGPESWDANPWCWRVEFRRVEVSR